MSAAPVIPPTAASTAFKSTAAAGFWSDAWRRFRRKPQAMVALVYVGLMFVVAFAAPLIIGTKPVVWRQPAIQRGVCLLDEGCRQR